MKWNKWTGEFDVEPQRFCEFGIGEAILGSSLASIFAGGLTDLGVGASTASFLGGVGSGALTGAGIGSIGSAITGGDPGTGALTGALTGGATGGAAGAGLGTGAQAAVGGIAGLAGAELTGGNPFFGAITGAAGPVVENALGLSSTGSSTPASSTASLTSGSVSGGSAGGTSAASPGAVSTPGSTPVDLTATSAPFGGTSDFATFGNTMLQPGGVNLLPPPGPGGTTATTGTGTGGGDLLSRGGNFLNNLVGKFENNPAALLGLGGLGLTLLQGPQTPAAANTLNQQAGEAATLGRTLEAYQLSGTLPSGLQQQVDSATNAAIAQTRSSFAQMGLSGSTQESQAIAAVKQQKSVQIAQIADSLAKQGIDWTQLSGQELTQVLKAQETAQANFTSALTNFARGLAGGGLPTQGNTSPGTSVG